MPLDFDSIITVQMDIQALTAGIHAIADNAADTPEMQSIRQLSHVIRERSDDLEAIHKRFSDDI